MDQRHPSDDAPIADTGAARLRATLQLRQRAAETPEGSPPSTQRPADGSQLVVALKQRLFVTLRRQGGHPRGMAGRGLGWVMAHRSSNRRRNAWVVALLEMQPTDRVLEVGFGPGLAIAELARLLTEGRVYGIDHSEVMLHQATKRNASAIRAGRIRLTLGTVEQLPPELDGPFAAILTVNSLGFWTAPAERLQDLRRRLTPGGRLAVASQPRCPGATRSTSLATASEITDLLHTAGFTQVRTEILDLEPPVVCVVAVNEDPRSGSG